MAGADAVDLVHCLGVAGGNPDRVLQGRGWIALRGEDLAENGVLFCVAKRHQ